MEIDKTSKNMLDTNAKVDLRYFIKLAIEKKIAWSMLKFFLNDLTCTFDKSKQVIDILVIELEDLVTKFQNRIDEITGKDEANSVQNDDIEGGKEKKNATQFKTFSDSDHSEILGDSEENDLAEELEENKVDSAKDGKEDQNFQFCEVTDFEKSLHISDEEEFLMKDEIVETPTSDQRTEEKLFHNDKKEVIPDIELSRFYEFIGNNKENQSDVKNKSKSVVKDTYQCKVCRRTFSKGNLGLHINPQDCEKCRKTFCNILTFKKHECYQTFEKPFQCNTCGESFRRKLTLKRHEIIHTGEKPFQCKICNMCFAEKGKLTVHDRTHTGERPFQCNMCSKAFKSNYNLKRHLKIHEQIKKSIIEGKNDVKSKE